MDSGGNVDLRQSERENLQSQLLSSVKNCQTRFGGKSELATELDLYVKKLISVLELVLSHGLKSKIQEKKGSTIKQVTDLVLGSGEQFTAWDCVQELLTNHERERYELLKQIWTDRGRARAWLRSAINERSLERYMTLLNNFKNIGQYYEDWAFLRVQESNSILPNLAAGLSSILFALSIDKPELNQASNDLHRTNFVAREEPIIQESQPDTSKKKDKRHKKIPRKIISFGDEEIIESPVKNEDNISTYIPGTAQVSLEEEGEGVGGEGEVECAQEATGIICEADCSNSDSDFKLDTDDNLHSQITCGLRPVNNSTIGELTPVRITEETHSSEDSISVPSFSEETEQGLTSNNIDINCSETGSIYDELSKNSEQLLVLLQKTKETNAVLQSQLVQTTQQYQQKVQLLETKVNELNRENEVLKHQLRKYVSAVQMLKQGGDEFEGEELFQQKLVQVAEMHGELMELNERLQRSLVGKEGVIRRLYLELEALRGPLGLGPSEIDISCQLISLWVPSVFLTGQPKPHHVYQIHIRIAEEEWNVYRRYSQFLTLHKEYKKVYPVITAFKFPPKKTLGNKDAKFVEERRQKLQQYLRRLLNHIIANNPQLTSIPNKTVLSSFIPFFGEPNDSPTERRPKVSYPRTVTNSPQYSGL